MPQRVIMLEIGLVTAVRFYKFEDFFKIYEKEAVFQIFNDKKLRDWHYTTTGVYQQKIVKRPQAHRNQASNRKSAMRCLLFYM